LTEVADALPLADVVDTILVSVRLGRSRRDKLEQLRRALAQRGVTPAGFVVTSRRVVKRPAYGYEYQGVERQTAEVEELKVRRSKVEVGPGE
jgi:Mrp family chromosome partitioning ATPase